MHCSDGHRAFILKKYFYIFNALRKRNADEKKIIPPVRIFGHHTVDRNRVSYAICQGAVLQEDEYTCKEQQELWCQKEHLAA